MNSNIRSRKIGKCPNCGGLQNIVIDDFAKCTFCKEFIGIIDDKVKMCNYYIKELEKEKLQIDIRYHRELFPDLPDLEIREQGNCIDVYCAQEIELKAFEFAYINLGISVKCPHGYYAELLPRSSTYKNYGIIQANHIGIIDETYQGDNDIWMMPVVALRDTVIPANERIAQFRIVKAIINGKDTNVTLNTVESLNGPDRGGLGSTGKE